MYTYAILALSQRYRPRLLSSHMDEFGAWTSFRAAPPPSVLARVDEGGVSGVSFLAAKGLSVDGLASDLKLVAKVKALLKQ